MRHLSSRWLKSCSGCWCVWVGEMCRLNTCLFFAKVIIQDHPRKKRKFGNKWPPSPQNNVLVFSVFFSLQNQCFPSHSLNVMRFGLKNCSCCRQFWCYCTLKGPSDVFLFRGGPANLQNCQLRTRENRRLSVNQGWQGLVTSEQFHYLHGRTTHGTIIWTVSWLLKQNCKWFGTVVSNIMVWFPGIIPSLVFKIECKILGSVSLLGRGAGGKHLLISGWRQGLFSSTVTNDRSLQDHHTSAFRNGVLFVDVKVSPQTLCRHMMGEGMNGSTASLILNLSTGLMCVFSFTIPVALPSGNAPPSLPPGSHWIEGRVGLRSSLDCLQKRKFHAPARIRTRILTTCRRFFLQKRTGCQLIKFPAFYETRRFIAVLTLSQVAPKDQSRPETVVDVLQQGQFLRWGIVSTSPKHPQLEDHPLSAVCGCLFNTFASALHIGDCYSLRDVRTRHAMVTGVTYHGRNPVLA